MGDVLYSELNDVTASRLAVDGQVEQGQIPAMPAKLKPDPDQPGLLKPERWLRSGQTTFVPWDMLVAVDWMHRIVVHGAFVPHGVRTTTMAHPANGH